MTQWIETTKTLQNGEPVTRAIEIEPMDREVYLTDNAYAEVTDEVADLLATNISNISKVSEPASPGSYFGDAGENTKVKIVAPDDTFEDLTVVGNASAKSVSTDELHGDWDTLVTSTPELESAFNNLSAGETVQIAQPPTPYRPTQWLDIDVDGVTVVAQSRYAEDGQPIVKPADGADVGGIRVGVNSPVEHVRIARVGYHGNESTMTDTVKRLHAFIVDDATDVTIENCFATRTHPYREHGTGGSGYSVRHLTTDVTIRGCGSDDIGDRAIQLGGKDITVTGCYLRNGFDRSVSFNLEEPDGNYYLPKRVAVTGNVCRDNSDGSCIGTNQVDPRAGYQAGDYVVEGNVLYGEMRRAVHISAAVSDVTITNNVCHLTTVATDPVGSGIMVNGGSGVANVTVGENVIRGYEREGILVNNGAIDVSVTGNVIRDVDVGIVVESSSNVSVTGNEIRTVEFPGINIIADDGATYTNIKATDNIVLDCAKGIVVQENAGTVDYYMVKDNIINGNSKTAVDDTASGGTKDVSGNLY